MGWNRWGLYAVFAAVVKLLQPLDIECRVACIYEGFDGGGYLQRLKTCECKSRLRLEDMLGPRLTLKLKTESYQNDVW